MQSPAAGPRRHNPLPRTVCMPIRRMHVCIRAVLKSGQNLCCRAMLESGQKCVRASLSPHWALTRPQAVAGAMP